MNKISPGEKSYEKGRIITTNTREKQGLTGKNAREGGRRTTKLLRTFNPKSKMLSTSVTQGQQNLREEWDFSLRPIQFSTVLAISEIKNKNSLLLAYIKMVLIL